MVLHESVRCWAGRISEPAGSWLAAVLSAGGSEIRPYHIVLLR